MECECQYSEKKRSQNFRRGQLGLPIFAGQKDRVRTRLIFPGENRRDHDTDCQNREHQKFKGGNDHFPSFIISVLKRLFHFAVQIPPIVFFCFRQFFGRVIQYLFDFILSCLIEIRPVRNIQIRKRRIASAYVGVCVVSRDQIQQTFPRSDTVPVCILN